MVPESGDDWGAAVSGVAASAALPECLLVFESGDAVFDVCSVTAVSPVAVAAGYTAGAISPGCGDGGDSAVATVAEVVALAASE